MKSHILLNNSRFYLKFSFRARVAFDIPTGKRGSLSDFLVLSVYINLIYDIYLLGIFEQEEVSQSNET